MKPKKSLVIILISAVLWGGAVIGGYVFAFRGREILIKTEAWGQFGDFIGGMLNPGFSFLALMALLITVYQNQKELEETRKEVKKSAEALKQQALHFERKEKTDEIVRLIENLQVDINSILEHELTLAVNGKNKKTIKESINQILSGRSAEEVSFLPHAKTPLPERPYYIYIQLSGRLVELSEYLMEYAATTKSEKLPKYFALRYYPSIKKLHQYEYIDGTILKYFEGLLHEERRWL